MTSNNTWSLLPSCDRRRDIQHNQIVAAGSLGSVGTEWHSLGLGTPLVLGAGLM